MKQLIFLFILFISFTCSSQEILTFCEKMPSFGQRPETLTEYISQKLQYPVDAANKGIQGKVVLRFVVNEDGSLSDIQLIKKSNPSLDEEAIRLIKSMPKWNPGQNQGKPVKVYFTLPIVFRLDIPQKK